METDNTWEQMPKPIFLDSIFKQLSYNILLDLYLTQP